ncbi:tRNA1(Val) (adenine(37)-N6)-methyltransferase [Mucilaginibacter sp. X4EP1]|uniref:tRNA1(Val) (adenine(37)-N6)-methyltransferase n=1 Tax=Mucilaginibacter sp. X4EP1 TaxID=2723092 RepID=UPI003AFF6855|nr:tRNA1Val (adenine37-N6)-methyltransferase [Mucilaginibacter sp. X4EP1]
MKINTDGVLLGALAVANNPASILDIGTGTGVIALMLAQRYAAAKVDAIEIDTEAAKTAERNFRASAFANKLALYAEGFETYFDQYPENKYDLIVSNPPFYIDSLKSPGAKKTLAKHTDIDFFERLINAVARHLSPDGCFLLIVPTTMADLLISLAANDSMFLQRTISIQSYLHSEPHRVILSFGQEKPSIETSSFVIYEDEGVYSTGYKELLKPYFINF